MSIRRRINVATGLSAVAILFSSVAIVSLALSDGMYMRKIDCEKRIKAHCNETYAKSVIDSMTAYCKLHEAQQAEIDQLRRDIFELGRMRVVR